MEERESKNEEAPATENHEGHLVEEFNGGTKEEISIASCKSEQIIDEAGSRTFTMRELLNEMKKEEAGKWRLPKTPAAGRKFGGLAPQPLMGAVGMVGLLSGRSFFFSLVGISCLLVCSLVRSKRT